MVAMGNDRQSGAGRYRLARQILFPESPLAGPADRSPYFGPDRLPGTLPIGARKTHPSLFQDTLDAEVVGYESWLYPELDRSLRALMAAKGASPLPPGPSRTIVKAAARILELPAAPGLPLNQAIPQQLYQDIFLRLLSQVVAGSAALSQTHLYQEFNALCLRLGDGLLRRMESRGWLNPKSPDIPRLIQVAVLSGYLGINLKSSASAASDLLNRELVPVPPAWVADMAAVRAVSPADLGRIAQTLIRLLDQPRGGFALESLESYYQEVVETREPSLLVFFSDDYLESIIDLKRFEMILEGNPCLDLLFVPRAGRYGNDLAFADLSTILARKGFEGLGRLAEAGRVCFSPHGPQAGCIDSRAIHRGLILEMERMGRDRRLILETKGCRNFEALRGGLPHPWYAAFNCNRALSIRTVGADGPPVFLRIPPGLEGYQGFARPRIGNSPSYGTAGVRFARMTTVQLYAGLQSRAYARLSARNKDEYPFHTRLLEMAGQRDLTFAELMADPHVGDGSYDG